MAYIICMGDIAKKPYTIKNSGLNIYSIEELCYYICNNIFDLEENFVNNDLCQFLSKELGLNNLAKKLQNMTNKALKEYDKLLTIVSYTDYLDANELLYFKTAIERIAGCKALERYKLKADHLVKKGRYEKAIYAYEQIIKDKDFEKQNAIFKSRLYYNMAVANAYIFHYNEAVKLFYHAYKYNKDDRSAFSTLCALYIDLEDKNDFMKVALKYGFSVTKVAGAEELLKSCLENIQKQESYTLEEVVEVARCAMS